MKANKRLSRGVLSVPAGMRKAVYCNPAELDGADLQGCVALSNALKKLIFPVYA